MWSALGTVHTELCNPKVSMGSSTMRRRPSMGSSTRQTKSCRDMEYRPNRTENNECRRCTILSSSTYIRATCPKPGTGSTPEAMWSKKECIPRPDHFYVDSGPPSSLVTLNHSVSSPTISLGSRPVPSTSPTNRGGQGGSRLTMTVRGRASV